MKKRLEYEILLNCILVEENVRNCFFIWCKKTFKICEYINKLFPNLILNKYEGSNKLLQLEKSDVLLISKNVIRPNEYDTDAKLGKLLGYLSAEEYFKLDRTINFYNYILVAKINNIEVYLYNELSQNKLDYSNIKNKVEKILKNNKLKIVIDDIYVKELLVKN
jgi:hypothetical protein